MITDDDILHYFAYGSNMLRERLTERVGDVHIVGGVQLEGYRLGFDMHGRDGSGKCNASLTREPRHSLHGVVYGMSPKQKHLLDQYEGPRYESRWLAVEMVDEAVKVFTYVGREEYVKPGLAPYSWYKAFVYAGALQHQLPGPYIADIAASETIPDPDEGRHQRNVEVLRATRYGSIID